MGFTFYLSVRAAYAANQVDRFDFNEDNRVYSMQFMYIYIFKLQF